MRDPTAYELKMEVATQVALYEIKLHVAPRKYFGPSAPAVKPVIRHKDRTGFQPHNMTLVQQSWHSAMNKY